MSSNTFELCSRYVSCSNPFCDLQHFLSLPLEDRIKKNPNNNIPHMRSAYEKDLLIKAVMRIGKDVVVK